MEKNDDKDPDHNDKSIIEEKADVVSDAHPPDESDGNSKENVDVGNAETEHNPEDNVESQGEEIQQTLESLSEELDQLLSSLSLHKEEHKDDNTEEKEKGDQEDDDYFQIPQFVGKFLDLLEDKLSKYDSGEPKTVWYQDQDEVSSLLEAVDRVSNLMRLLLNTKSCLDHHEPLINHAGSIQQRAMAFLEDEFRILLEESVIKETTDDTGSQRKSTEDAVVSQDNDQVTAPEPGDQEIEYPGYSEDVVALLRKIAEKMKAGGYGWECREVYLVGRRNILMRTLKENCEFEKVSIDEVQKMSWGELEREIPIWTKTFKNCSSLFFPGELKLAEKIFPGEEGSLFCIVAHGLTIQFLGFAEAVAMTKRSTEKLFKILDIYETLRDSFPPMEELFPEELRSELRNEVTSVRSRLGESAINIFSDLENSIKSDSSKTPVPGGAVHPLTRYTMNYLKYSCEYKDTLEQVFKSHSKMEQEEEEVPANNSACSAFASQLMRIMDLLDGNMEAKSKLYKDIPLSCIFMMNNGRYIVQKIKGSAEIHEVMGDTWCRRRSSELRNYHKSYQRETWGKLLGFLGHEGLMHNGKIVKPNLKERFKSFNATFDEIHKTQTTWVINDEQLQSELRVSITAVMIPAYRAFMARFGQYLDPGRQTEKPKSSAVEKEKSQSPLIAQENVVNLGLKARNKDKLPKHSIQQTDGAKYMSYLKISKKQYQIVTSMKQSGKSIQSKALNKILGNINNLDVQPYGVFVEEEQKKLNAHWLQLVKDLPTSYVIWRKLQLQKRDVISSLERELKDKLNPWMEVCSEKPLQKHNVQLDLRNYDGDSLDPNQSGDLAPDVEDLGSLDQVSAKNQSLSKESSSDSDQITDSGRCLQVGEHPSQVSSPDCDNSINMEDTEANDYSSSINGQSLPQAPFPSEPHASDLGDANPSDERLPSTSSSHGDELQYCSGGDVWQPVGGTRQSYVGRQAYTPSGGLSIIHHPEGGEEEKNYFIEPDMPEEVDRRKTLQPGANTSFGSFPSNDQNELLQSLFKGQGGVASHSLLKVPLNEEHKQIMPIGFQQEGSNNLMEGNQFSGQFQHQMSAPQPLPQDQPRQVDIYGQGSLPDNIYCDGRGFLMPRPDWNASVAQLGVTTQPPLNTGPLLNQNWQFKSMWANTNGVSQSSHTGSERDMNLLRVATNPEQMIHRGSSPDQSLFSVFSQCNQLRRSRSALEPESSSAQVNYEMLMGGGTTQAGSSLAQPTNPLDYLSGSNNPAATSLMPDDAVWMNQSRENSGLHDPLGKLYPRSWNP
ncbi:unnamed protein product [Brassica rapa subsp. narinosa]